ncbi:MAG TPA: hypothetical protein VHL31_24080 [Geminicoccus sp.]|jgi:hypothetical protein|uniref:hypothetical protein n=1 Tax=Geminicoccus sp. TaxID=2024832 RepID=UPI002E32BDAC|nr:hypothetical protein [Geminicoccus sp.]HEX2529358.1 hypothetical protein [Geminicoccus sp.]
MRKAFLPLVLLAVVPVGAMAERATGSLQVGVTVVAACPPGSGKPCAPAAPPTAVQAPAAVEDRPIMVLRNEEARTVTVVY